MISMQKVLFLFKALELVSVIINAESFIYIVGSGAG